MATDLNLAPVSDAKLAELAARSQRLQNRIMVTIDLANGGKDHVFAGISPRWWGTATSLSPNELVGLISSIASVGVLEPLLLEQDEQGSGAPRYRVVAGERRLRACLWGYHKHPENPNFQTFQACVVQGPLSDEDRYIWQLITHLARADLKPAELAAALLYERSALMAARITDAGTDVPDSVLRHEDPVTRFAELDKFRTKQGLHNIGAPWPDVIARLGLQLPARRCTDIVKAFKSLPTEVSTDMDANDVSIRSRLSLIKLSAGRTEATEEIWAAIKARGHPERTTTATTIATQYPDADLDDILDRTDTHYDELAARRQPTEAGKETTPVDPAIYEQADRAIKQLLVQLRAGAELPAYVQGTLRLQLGELEHLISQSPRQSVPAA